MKLYKIDKGIKLPKPRQVASDGRPSVATATMEELARGDSFIIKNPLEAVHAEKKMRNKNARERERGGKRQWVSRRDGDAVRIWRVN